MVKLIKYFNENYGNEYGNVEYPRTKKEMYQTYQIIKAYGIKDDKLMNLLNECVLPKPTSIREREMYSECLYEVGKNGKLSEFENDLYYYKRTPFLRLTKDEFTYDENRDAYVYIRSPKLSPTEDFEKIGYNLSFTLYQDQDAIIYTEKTYPLNFGIWDSVASNGTNISLKNKRVYFEIVNGARYDCESDDYIEGDSFSIVIYIPKEINIINFELELFKIESNEIPENCLNFNKIILFDSDNYEIKNNYINIHPAETGVTTTVKWDEENSLVVERDWANVIYLTSQELLSITIPSEIGKIVSCDIPKPPFEKWEKHCYGTSTVFIFSIGTPTMFFRVKLTGVYNGKSYWSDTITNNNFETYTLCITKNTVTDTLTFRLKRIN